MDVIDENGRLFGVVNVVDALVVLVVLAILVASVALLTGGQDADGDDAPAPERFAVVAFDVPLESDAATVSTGETLSAVGESDAFGVADVYRGFTPNGSAYLVTKLSYRGEMTVGGATVYGGDEVALTTGSYRVDGQVLGVNRTHDAIPTAAERVVLMTTVRPMVADAIEEGDVARFGGATLATVTAVDRTETADGRVRVLLGAELTVWDREPVPAFDGNPLRVDNRVTLVTDTVTIPGRLAAVGTDDPAAVEDG